jgi:hypothetical protein
VLVDYAHTPEALSMPCAQPGVYRRAATLAGAADAIAGSAQRCRVAARGATG